MIFTANKGQTSYGEAIGILLLDTETPFILGDVGNAKSYDYPVRFKTVEGLLTDRIFAHDYSFIEGMIAGAQELEREGVKAITGDCGFMAIFNEEVQKAVSIPFIQSTLPAGAKIGVLTANSDSLTPEVFGKIGLNDVSGLVIRGLQHDKHFKDAVVDEVGTLDSDGIRAEVVQAATEITSDHPEIRSLLLECSMMPPYSEAVQQATALPVYDFLTMIDYVYSAVVKKHFADAI
jgi:hypothetical protein